MRNWKRLAGLMLILTMVVAGCTGAGSSGREGVGKGDRALDFTLEALEEGEVSLSDHVGSVVLVNFWAAWCPPCRAEIPDLEAAYQKHKDEGLVVLGINVQDSPEAAEFIVTELEMTYPVLLDESGQVMKKYRSPGLPMSVIVDRDGVIRVRHAGYLSAEKLAEYLAQVLP